MWKERDWEDSLHKDTEKRKSSRLWNDLKQPVLVMDFLRERGRKLQGCSPPPVSDWWVPMWWKSIWLITQPSPPPKPSSVCPAETFAAGFLLQSHCRGLPWPLFPACHSFCASEKHKHHIKNLHGVPAGGQCGLEARSVHPANTGVWGGGTAPVPRERFVACLSARWVREQLPSWQQQNQPGRERVGTQNVL